MKAIYLLLVCVMLGSIVTSCSVEPVEIKTEKISTAYSTGDGLDGHAEPDEDDDF